MMNGLNAGSPLLTKRQELIIRILLSDKGQYFTSEFIASSIHVSARTIKSEIKELAKIFSNDVSFRVISTRRKGTKIEIFDNDAFSVSHHDFIACPTSQELPNNLSKDTRALDLCVYLLNNSKYTRKESILDQLAISEATFYSTLHVSNYLLREYGLKIVHRNEYGYSIRGDEAAKRTFIIENESVAGIKTPDHMFRNVNRIYSLVAETFIKYKYQIDENTINNITNHIIISAGRVRRGFTIKSDFNNNRSNESVYKIADEILSKILSDYNIDIREYQGEVDLLALIILGKINYSTNNEFQNYINKFIDHSFSKIAEKYSVNFAPLEDLKISLSMHISALYYRAKSGTQLSNSMSTEIQQSFLLATDIATYFAGLLADEMNIDIRSDEIAYLSLYFNYGLEKWHLDNSAKRILVITSLRKSETILLQHKIYEWFPNQIAEISFANDKKVSDLQLDEYDAVFNAGDNYKQLNNGFPCISIFPSDNDYKKMYLAINGYTNVDDILSKFLSDCFYVGDVKSKDDALNIVCNNAMSVYHLDQTFQKEILKRENIANSYFGNKIALPHPLTPITDNTITSVAIFKHPIDWDVLHKVQIVILVSVARNNPKALQFWYYLSNFIRNEESVKELLKHPTYEMFVKLLKDSLNQAFSSKTDSK